MSGEDVSSAAPARSVSAERTVTRACDLAGGPTLTLRLMVRLTTPGEPCYDIATDLAFAIEPPLPDEIVVRLDDRLYDGIYAALAEIEDPLPPEHLAITVPILVAEPPLAAVLELGDWTRVAAVGDCLADLACGAVIEAWRGLANDSRRG